MSEVLAGTLLATFVCVGKPRTKGSLKPYPVRNGRGQMKIVLQDDNPESKTWRAALIKVIRDTYGIKPIKRGNKVIGFVPEPYSGPVVVHFTAYFERLCEADRELPYPTRESGEFAHGDGDKLERNLWDALTQSGLIKDDSMVVEWTGRKRWTDGTLSVLFGQRERQGIVCEVIAA